MVYRWAKPKAKINGNDMFQMAFHILLSALNGHQFTVFCNFYKDIKEALSSRTKHKLFKLYAIKRLRLYSIPLLQSSST